MPLFLCLTSRLISHKMRTLDGRTNGRGRDGRGRLFFPSKFVATAVVIRLLPPFLPYPSPAVIRARVGKKN